MEERERGHGGDGSRCTGRVGEVYGGGGYGDWRDDVKEEEEDSRLKISCGGEISKLPRAFDGEDGRS